MPGKCEIQIDKAVPPVQHRPIRSPIMMRADTLMKFKELEDAGVISGIDEPTEWISSQVASPQKAQWNCRTMHRFKIPQQSYNHKSLPNTDTGRCLAKTD